MQCDDVLERLPAFQDDELDPVASREIQQHLETCRSCSDAVGQLAALGERLRAEAPYYPAPDSLRARVSQAVWSQAGRDRSGVRRMGVPGRGWLSAAAAVVVLVGGTWILTSVQRQEGSGSLERQLVSSHIRSLMAAHLTDVASTDQHTVKPWFNGKLDFSPPVTDLSASEYPLIGGRLDYVSDQPVAALVYQHGKHPINVFVWPDDGTKESTSSPRTRQGYHIIHATRGGMAYWIVSDLNLQELSAFARMLVPASSTR